MKKIFTTLTAIFCCAMIWAQSPVTIVETGEGYGSLTAAVNAVADGQTIKINQNIEYNATLNPNAKKITIEGADGVTITYQKDGVFFNVNNADGSLVVKNLHIKCVADTVRSNLVQQSSGSLYMENVQIEGANQSVNISNGLIRIYTQNNKPAPVSTTIDGVRFSGCTVTNDYYLLVAPNNYGVTLKGECDYTIRLNNTTSYIIDGGVTNDRPAAISFQKRSNDVKVVEGCTDLLRFYSVNTANGLTVLDGNLVASAYSKYVALEGDKVTTATSLPNAANAITAEGTVLLYADAELSSAVSANGKTISFRGVRPSVKINRSSDRLVGNAGAANTHLTFRDLTITSSVETSTAYLFQATTSGASVTLKDVTISGVHNTSYVDNNGKTVSNSLARANAGGVLNIDGVICEDCSVEGNNSMLFTVNQNACTLSGANSGLSIRLRNAAAATIDATGLAAGGTPITIYMANAANNFALFGGCSNPEVFTISNANWSLAPNAIGGLTLLDGTVETPAAETYFPQTKETVASFYTFVGGELIYPYCIRLNEGTTTLTFAVPADYDLYYRIDPYSKLTDEPNLDDHLKEHPEDTDSYRARAMANAAESDMTLYTEPIEVPSERNVLLTLVNRNNINNTASQILQVVPSNLVQTGVEAIAAENAPAEYYTLGGVRADAASLTPGIYVMRRGGHTSKVIVR